MPSSHPFRRRPVGRRVALAAGAVVAAGLSGIVATTAQAAPVTYPVVAGMGLQPSPAALVAAAARPNAAAAATTEPLPASVDLTPWAVPAGDQGQIGSCASWTVGYTISGWYARKQGSTGVPYAPMFLYSQITNGRGGPTVGTSFYSNLSLEQSGGVDPLSDYTQGNYNTTQLPSAAQKANAAGYKLVDWTTLYWSQPQAASQGAALIKDALAHNRPVAIGMDVYTNFFYVGPTTDHYDAVSGGFAGRHAVAVLGYDVYGVRIENSWSSGWGNRGFAWLSWGFVAAHTSEAYSVNGFTAPSAGPAPVLTSLSSASGPWTGGTIKLNGSNLTGATVTFGSVAATNVTVNGAGTEATVGVPAALTGKVAVAATAATGGKSNTLDYTYTAAAPAISGVTPAFGPSTGGRVVTLTGSNLNPIAGAPYTVLFGAAAATKVVVAADGRSLTAVAPAGSVGPVSVKVVNAGGTSGTAAFAYTWPVAPVVTLTAPAGTMAPGATVTLAGAVRQPNGTAYAKLAVVLQSRPKGSTASFALLATGVTATNGAVAFAVVAAASAEYRLAIVGDVASTPLAVTVVPPPTVTALSASAGPRTGGQTIVVTGTNLAGGSVTVGTTVVKALSVNAAGTMLTFVTPARAVDAVGVVVSTATGASRAIAYIYRA